MKTPFARSCIRTRYLAASNSRGARVTASGPYGDRRTITRARDFSVDLSAQHAQVAAEWLEINQEVTGHRPTVLSPDGMTYGSDYFWTWEYRPWTD